MALVEMITTPPLVAVSEGVEVSRRGEENGFVSVSALELVLEDLDLRVGLEDGSDGVQDLVASSEVSGIGQLDCLYRGVRLCLKSFGNWSIIHPWSPEIDYIMFHK